MQHKMRSLFKTLVAAGVLACMPALHAATITGSITGTVEAGQGADPLNIFGCPAMDCGGLSIQASWSYDPDLFGPPTTGPGFSDAKGVDIGSFSETINSVTQVVDSGTYFFYYAGTAPAQPNDVFQLGADSVEYPIPGGTEADYTLISFIPGGTFLNGLGPVQNLSGPVSSDSGGALEVTQYLAGGPVSDTILFTVNSVSLNAAAPEPASWLLMGTALIAVASARRRRSI